MSKLYGVNEIGNIYGNWTVIGFSHKTGRCNRSHWLCRCKCGAERPVNQDSLRTGKSLSCGCMFFDKTRGWHGTTTWRSWRKLCERCLSPTCRQFKDYGGRGITVCERWRRSFLAFLEDMGEKPVGLSIERINNEGNYEPGNCKWANTIEQARNKRTTRLLQFGDRLVSLAEVAETTGINAETLRYRLDEMKLPLEEAIYRPVKM